MTLTFQPEIELLLVCARWRLDEAATARLRDLVEQQTDWDALFVAAERHAVLPLLFERLNAAGPLDVPAGLMNRLRERFYANAARNLRLAEELSRIIDLFEAAGVPLIAYKGPLLAEALYGSVALRQFSDLDLLVQRADVSRACALLDDNGFKREHRLTPAQEAFFLRSECELMFSRAERPVFLDLHWDFAPRYFSLSLDPEPMWERLATVLMDRRPVRTLGAEDTLLVLAVHAGKDFWQRFVSLSDIAGWLAAHPALDWSSVMERATAAHARRILLVSLRLAQQLFDAPLPEAINQEIEREAAACELAAGIARELFREARSPAPARKFLRPVRAQDSLRRKLGFCLRLALTPSPEDWAFARIPDRFISLYYLTRPLRLALKYRVKNGSAS